MAKNESKRTWDPTPERRGNLTGIGLWPENDPKRHARAVRAARASAQARRAQRIEAALLGGEK